MPEYIKVNIGKEAAYLDERNGGNWTKQLKAPDMPGMYKMTLEVASDEGNIITHELHENLIVLGKCFDLGRYGKINEILIKRIVLNLAGCASHVIFEDSTIHVYVCIDKYDASVLESIEKILLPKIPAHLNLSVKKYYSSCWDVKRDFVSCNNIMARFSSCQELRDYIPKHRVTCREIKHDFATCAELSASFPDCRDVLDYRSSDYAICNEIKTGIRTCADLTKIYENCGELMLYKPVEPLREGS